MDEIEDVNTNAAEEKFNKQGKVELSFATLRHLILLTCAKLKFLGLVISW